MPFYPKSQYQSGFSTNGGEYSTLSPNGPSYKGPYYKTSTGKIISGTSPLDLSPGAQEFLYSVSSNPLSNPENSLERIDTINDQKVITVLPQRNYINYFYLTRNLPIPFKPSLTSKSKKLGIFERYFCKKNNELKYFEISQETFNLLNSQSKSIAFDLYSPIKMMWYIKGEKEKVYTLNKRMSESIEKKEKWYGFSQYFKDKFTQFYLED